MIPIRKRDICEQQLRKMCKNIAEDITAGEEDAGQWMQGVYDIEQVTTGSAGQETDVTRILEGKFNVYPEATF